jgi:hypothetical protein
MFDLQKLVMNHQNRGKIFNWVELLTLTGKYPEEIKKEIDETRSEITDPFLPYTQSGKNYNTLNDDFIINNYSNPELFKIGYNEYGVSSEFNLKKTFPTNYHWQDNIDWFWQQKTAAKVSKWLYCIPGIKKVYLLGSTSLEVSEKNSDLDIAFLCYPGCVLLSRFWAKIWFKILRVDTFSFTLNLKLILLSELFRINKSNWVENKIKITKADIWEFKNRLGLKIDLGMCYEKEEQVTKYYGNDERQLPILHKLLLIESAFDPNIFEDSNLGRIFAAEPFAIVKVLQFIIKILLWIISPLIYPLAILQIQWNKLKHNKNLNHIVKFNFCSFYPRFPEEKFVTKLNSD